MDKRYAINLHTLFKQKDMSDYFPSKYTNFKKSKRKHYKVTRNANFQIFFGVGYFCAKNRWVGAIEGIANCSRFCTGY